MAISVYSLVFHLYLFKICRDIAKDIGEQQLSKCYDVMGQIEDDKIVQVTTHRNQYLLLKHLQTVRPYGCNTYIYFHSYSCLKGSQNFHIDSQKMNVIDNTKKKNITHETFKTKSAFLW